MSTTVTVSTPSPSRGGASRELVVLRSHVKSREYRALARASLGAWCVSQVQHRARWGDGAALPPGPPGINGAFHGEESRGPAVRRFLEGRGCVRQAQGPPGRSASLQVAWLGPCLPRNLELTMTLLVTAPSRRSGGTRSSRAAVWISAQLDTAATSWDSLCTEEGGSRGSSACASHRAGARPGFA